MMDKTNKVTGFIKKESTSENNFWKDSTLEEIMAEQGAKPVNSLDELYGYWPEGADFDSFYEAAVNSREHADSK
jgi:hypothetical protein